MLVPDDPQAARSFKLTSVEDYEPLIGSATVERLLKKVEVLRALQRRAAVVLQKSIREGFGLTVTEAMWKGAAVIGGNVGGIKHQIEDGVNGFLVNNAEEAAARIVALLKDRALRERLGRKARESVRGRFLMTRLMEDRLDLIGSFEARFQLKGAAQR
jgi:trehalose synthase